MFELSQMHDFLKIIIFSARSSPGVVIEAAQVLQLFALRDHAMNLLMPDDKLKILILSKKCENSLLPF